MQIIGARTPAAAALLLAGALVTGCSAGSTTAVPSSTPTPPSSSIPASPGASPAATASSPAPVETAAPAGTLALRLTVSGSQVTGDTGTVDVPLGKPVQLTVTSDVADEVHVHGADVHADVEAGGTVVLDFTQQAPGRFEVELENSKRLLTRFAGPLTVASSTVVLAHAVGVRTDLPVPVLAVVVSGAFAVLVSFVALGALWRTSRLRGERAGAVLPGAVQRLLDSRVLLGVARAVALVVVLFVLVVAVVGPTESSFNLAPYAFYVTFWVGIVPASLLLGGVWGALNPLRTVYAGLARLTGPAPGADTVNRLGLWPAAGFLLAYAWVELVYPDRAIPRTLGVLLVAYAVVQLVAALWYGEGWFERGDAFEVYSRLLGRLSPLGRRADGRWVLRNPLDGADGTLLQPGLAAFVTCLVGTTAFDGITRATWYQDRFATGEPQVLLPTAGLLLTVLVVSGLYAGATSLAGRVTGTPDAPALFAHSVLPIAAGYAIAHYFSLLFLEGQLTWILASNPFGVDGVDLFGTYRNAVDLTAVSPDTIATVQVVAIVLGHVLGVVLAHDRAVRLGGTERRARTSQYPLLAVMVGLTCGGLGLLLG